MGNAGERISGSIASSSVKRSAAPAAWLTSPQISETWAKEAPANTA